MKNLWVLGRKKKKDFKDVGLWEITATIFSLKDGSG